MTNTVSRRRGFTIVELLIVIVVIGILAAITIVAFNGVQNKAKASAAQSAVSQASKKIIAYAAENFDQYPPSLTAAGITNTQGLEYSYNNDVSPRTYGVTATEGSFSYFVSSTSTKPTSGGYQGHGSGGAAAITNLHINPGAVSTTGYGSWAGDTGSTNAVSSVASSWSLSGSAVRTTWTAVVGVNGDLQVALNNAAALSANTVYTVRYRISAGQNSSISAPGLYAASGVYSYSARSQTSDTVMTAGNPVTLWLTFQADGAALSSGLRALVSPRSKVVGHSYDISEVVIYAGAYNSAIGFYSGASPNWIWNGVANNSTSTGAPL